jgi:Tfp pilus assembly protein PilF
MHGANSDYIFRAAGVSSPDVSVERLKLAIHANPQNSAYYFDAAQAEMRLPHADADAVRKDFQAGLALDPNNVAARLEFADILAKLSEPAEARDQYRLALQFNDRLNWDEGKRLTKKQLDDVNRKLSALSPATRK